MNPAEIVREPRTKLFGLMAEFADHERLLHAAEAAREHGYTRMDAYSPFPIEHLSEAIGEEPSIVPLLTLLGGMTGGVGGYFMQWYAMGHLYALNVGGRPFNSWPNYIPITFELTVLCAAVTALLAMLLINRLPELHHPVFGVPEFRRASIDRFFLCIESADPRFSMEHTKQFLLKFEPVGVKEVTV